MQHQRVQDRGAVATVPGVSGRAAGIDARAWPSPAGPDFFPIAAWGRVTAWLLVGAALALGAAAAAELLGVGPAALHLGALAVGLDGLAALAFHSWFFWAYRNLRALGERTERALPWAVIAWFVPVLNLVWPYGMIVEAYRGSRGPEHALSPTPRWLAAWWAVWVFGVVGFWLFSLGPLWAFGAWAWIGRGIDVVAGLGAARVVLDVGEAQTRRDAAARGVVEPVPF